MKRNIVVVDVTQDTVVHTFTEVPVEIPENNDVLWVPDNGDVAYYIKGREFDYEQNEVRLLCEPASEIEKQ